MDFDKLLTKITISKWILTGLLTVVGIGEGICLRKKQETEFMKMARTIIYDAMNKK